MEARKKGWSSVSNASLGDCLHNADNPKYEETNFKSTFLCRNVSKTFRFPSTFSSIAVHIGLGNSVLYFSILLTISPCMDMEHTLILIWGKYLFAVFSSGFKLY